MSSGDDIVRIENDVRIIGGKVDGLTNTVGELREEVALTRGRVEEFMETKTSQVNTLFAEVRDQGRENAAAYKKLTEIVTDIRVDYNPRSEHQKLADVVAGQGKQLSEMRVEQATVTTKLAGWGALAGLASGAFVSLIVTIIAAVILFKMGVHA